MNSLIKLVTLITILIAWLFTNAVFSQSNVNAWYFHGRKLDFATNPPTSTLTQGFTSNTNLKEGCTQACDANGNLLFYSNGISAFDASGNVMPNGTGLLGGAQNSGTMQALAIKRPNSQSQFFLFCQDQYIPPGWGTMNGVSYSVVDMSLNGGLGDIVPLQKNIPIITGFTSEKMAAVSHGNGIDFWLTIHMNGTNGSELHSYLITESGVSSSPIISSTTLPNFDMCLGYARFSHDCSKFAMSNDEFEFDGIKLFEFDNLTGQFEFLASVGIPDAVSSSYSIEFSPDNSKIYYGTESWGDNQKLYQVDLNSANYETSLIWQPNNGQTYTINNMLLGPDNRIYVRICLYGPNPFEDYFCVINEPNLLGAACDFQFGVIQNPNPDPVITGLPNMPRQGCLNLSIDFSINNCLNDTTHIDVLNDVVMDSIIWNFDLIQNVNPNILTLQSPSHLFDQPGVYNISATYYAAGIETQVNVQITIYENPVVQLGEDLVLCAAEAELAPENISTSVNILWSTNQTSPTINVNASGTYWIDADLNGCFASDTIEVTLIDLDVNLGPDIYYCSGEQIAPITLNSNVSDVEYLWSDESTDQILEVHEAGTYYVIVQNGPCTASDTIHIYEVTFDAQIFIQDTIGCKPLETSFSVGFNGSDIVTDYLWSFGDGQTSNLLNPTNVYENDGNYEVSILFNTSQGCEFSFSVQANIELIEKPIASFNILPNPPTIDNDVHLLNTSLHATDYQWFKEGVYWNSNVNNVNNFSNYGRYQMMLIANNSHCDDTATLVIHIKEDIVYYIPNTFTPDGDMHNNIFLPIFTSGFDEDNYSFIIFNRWGEVVFESNNYTIGWDGAYLGRPAPDGVYIYQVSFEDLHSANKHEIRGHLNLIR